jgi:hypothetical protein
MEKSSQRAWKIVPSRHFFPLKVVPLRHFFPLKVVPLRRFFPLKVVPLIEVLLYLHILVSLVRNHTSSHEDY